MSDNSSADINCVDGTTTNKIDAKWIYETGIESTEILGSGISEDLESNLSADKYTDTRCNYYAFELDFGRDKMAIDCVDIVDKTYSLQTAEQLYDLIMLLNEEYLNEEQERK